MPDYTPGPWSVRSGDTIRRPCLIQADGFVIAETHWNEHMEGEPEANARLIAAAPELLEALKVAERFCPCGARPESPHTHPHVAGCLIAIAIAKAEGR